MLDNFLMYKGYAALGQQNLTDAYFFFQQQLNTQGSSADLLRGLALTWVSLDDISRARSYLEEALEFDFKDEEVLLALAYTHVIDGNDPEATDVYERVLEFYPGNTFAAMQLGYIALRKELWETAEFYFKNSLASNPFQDDLLIELAKLSLLKNNSTEARSLLKKALLVEEARPDAYELLKQIADQAQDNVVSARMELIISQLETVSGLDWQVDELSLKQELAKLADGDGPNPFAADHLTFLAVKSGDLDMARHYNNVAKSAMPGLISAEIRSGEILVAAGESKDAIDHYKNLLQKYPDHYMLRYRLGYELAKNNDLNRAKTELEKAVSLNPFNSYGLFELAMIYDLLDEDELALSFYERVLKVDPFQQPAVMGIINIATVLGQHEKMMRMYQRYMAIGPFEARVLVGLSRQLLNETTDKELPELLLRKALTIDPEHQPAKDLLDDMLHHDDRIAVKLNELQDRLRESPADTEIMEELASYYYQIRYLGDATEIYEQLHNLLPNDLKVIRQLAFLYTLTGNNEELITLAEPLIAQNINDTELLSYLGTAYLSQGEVDMAEKNISLAIKLEPQNAVAINSLGVLRLQQGRLDEAAALYERSMAISPFYSLPATNLASLYLNADQTELAEKLLDKVIAYDKDNPAALAYQAYIAQGRGQLKKALHLGQKALKFNRESLMAIKVLAMLPPDINPDKLLHLFLWDLFAKADESLGDKRLRFKESLHYDVPGFNYRLLYEQGGSSPDISQNEESVLLQRADISKHLYTLFLKWADKDIPRLTDIMAIVWYYQGDTPGAYMILHDSAKSISGSFDIMKVYYHYLIIRDLKYQHEEFLRSITGALDQIELTHWDEASGNYYAGMLYHFAGEVSKAIEHLKYSAQTFFPANYQLARVYKAYGLYDSPEQEKDHVMNILEAEEANDFSIGDMELTINGLPENFYHEVIHGFYHQECQSFKTELMELPENSFIPFEQLLVFEKTARPFG